MKTKTTHQELAVVDRVAVPNRVDDTGQGARVEEFSGQPLLDVLPELDDDPVHGRMGRAVEAARGGGVLCEEPGHGAETMRTLRTRTALYMLDGELPSRSCSRPC